MNDRFKFRIALHQDKYEEYGLEKFKNQRIFEVKTLNVGYENSTVEIIADYPNGDWAVREIDEDDVEIMQCTGLKDKNGTLIYEGDIVEVQYIGGQIPLFKNEFSREPETERFEIFCHPEWLKFYAKNDNYRKTCEIHSLDLEQIRVNTYNKVYEVIGNIYENRELLNERN